MCRAVIDYYQGQHSFSRLTCLYYSRLAVAYIEKTLTDPLKPVDRIMCSVISTYHSQLLVDNSRLTSLICLTQDTAKLQNLARLMSSGLSTCTQALKVNFPRVLTSEYFFLVLLKGCLKFSCKVQITIWPLRFTKNSYLLCGKNTGTKELEVEGGSLALPQGNPIVSDVGIKV